MREKSPAQGSDATTDAQGSTPAPTRAPAHERTLTRAERAERNRAEWRSVNPSYQRLQPPQPAQPAAPAATLADLGVADAPLPDQLRAAAQHLLSIVLAGAASMSPRDAAAAIAALSQAATSIDRARERREATPADADAAVGALIDRIKAGGRE